MKLKREKRTKKINTLIVLGLLICAALTFPALASDTSGVRGNTCYTHGDINADGSVTGKDAIQLLYYATIEDEYSVEQDCDFDGDDAVDVKDAIRLLYSVSGNFFENLGYKLNGVVHAYQDPIWVWNIDGDHVSVTAKYRCACGERQETVIGEVELKESAEPTCTEDGSVTYSAKAIYDNVEFDTTKTIVVEATGHELGEQTCSDRECQNPGCNYVEKSTGHNFGEAQVTAATCTKAEVRKYICEDCDYEYEEQVGTAKGHTLNSATLEEVSVDEDTCEYKQLYTCTACEQQVESGRVHKHSYEATIAKEATCKEAGSKTYKCAKCGDASKEAESIAVNTEAHIWNTGATSGDITTYTCTLCNATRTTVNASQQKTANVSKETLANVTEVEVNNASIKLDSVLEQLGDNVQVSVDTVTVNDVNISAEEKAQIGDNPIYDFSLSSDNGTHSEFNGKTVTVSLPYDLKEGDDADCIDVWFINDEGEVEIVQGVYSNGYVTFTTDHFSYYTVTRLTPKQRCAKYGHAWKVSTVAATCEKDGYTLSICGRCAATETVAGDQRLGHDYTEVIVEATCVTDGSKTETCKNCNDTRTAIIPKTGHTWETTEENAATCEKQGDKKQACENCDETKTEVIPKLSHSFEDTTVEPTCDVRGYDSSKCKNCGHEEKANEKDALGHDYEASWEWVEDEGSISASLTLKCKHDEKHVVVKDASVDIEKQVAPSCSKGGSTTYVATISYNQVIYDNTHVVGEESYEHVSGEEWKHNSTKHYHLCTLCGEKTDEADHVFDEGTVTSEATCAEAGSITYTCACGYKKVEEIPTLEHNFKDDVCTECGYNLNECNHELTQLVENNFSEADGICGEGYFDYETCECGEVKYLLDYGFYACDIEWESQSTTDANGYQMQDIGTCSECQMVIEERWFWEVSESCEGAQIYQATIYTKDNTELVKYEGFDWEGWIEEHPIIVSGEVVDMTTYGLCGGTVTRMTCPCGEESGFSDDTRESGCNWVYDYANSPGSTSVYTCSECGVQKKSTSTTTKEGCKEQYTYTLTFSKGGEQLVEFVSTNTYDSHDVEYSFDMDGTTCSDGYTVTETCKDCGAVETYYERPAEEHGHFQYLLEKIELPDDTCGGYISKYMCPCGETNRIESYGMNCSMWMSDEREEMEGGYIKTSIGKCEYCDLKRENVETYTVTEQKCTYEGERVTTYSLGNTKLAEVRSEVSTHVEDYVQYDYVLSGDNCEDGVQITRECTECGSGYTYTTRGHDSFTKERYNLADYGMCGGTIEVRGCACGEDEWLNVNDEYDDACEWYHWKWDEETDTSYYKCVECGMTKITSHQEGAISGCLVQDTTTYEYLKGYNVVLSVESSSKGYSHNYEYEFIFSNEDAVCSDGYTVKEVCKDCGESDSWHTQPPVGEHWTYELQTYDMTEYGFCGGEVLVRGCACGERTYVEFDTDCDWIWYNNNSDSDGDWYKCLECGGTYSREYERQDAEGCYYITKNTYTFYDADMTKQFSFVTKERWESHNYDVTFALNEGGTTCSDGYTVTHVCKDCGYTYKGYGQTEEGEHNTYTVKDYRLADYGFCGGGVYVNECPCGAISDYWRYTNGDEDSCNWRWYKYDEATDADWYVCSECDGTYYYICGEETVEGCSVSEDRTFVFYDKDMNEVLSVSGTNTWFRHDYEVLNYTLIGNSCEEGVIENVICKHCGHEDRQTRHYHETRPVTEYDMSAYGVCGEATIYYEECYCGESKYVDYDEMYEACDGLSHTENRRKDEDGKYHDVYVRYCNTCDFRIQEDTVAERDASTCTEEVTKVVTINVGDELVTSFTYTYTRESHDYENTATLLPTSKDCEDGVLIVYTCKDCEYSYRNTYYHHYGVEVPGSRIDLSQFGSACGGYVVQKTCACGEYNSLSMEDAECDFGSEWTKSWLGDELYSQTTAEGSFWPNDYTYIDTCAVTDPDQCGFAIAQCHYYLWDKEACRATEYLTWLLGYDKETGDYEHEITIECGQRTYHDYEYTHSTEETENGDKYVNLHTCSQCGSTQKEISTYTYDTDGNRSGYTSEAEWVNKLLDGENQYRYVKYEYEQHFGYDYTMLDYNKTIDENGVETWYKYEYIYDWENFDCSRICKYSDSHGNVDEEYTQSHYEWRWVCNEDMQITCSQYGEGHYECAICGLINEDSYEIITPMDHNWEGIDSEEGYRCMNCGLENINGASGAIIMEDMTEAYGNNTSYVVGYWNRDEVDFTYYVSAVPTSEELDEIVLDEETVGFVELSRKEDGIQAISFNKAEAEAAAKVAAEAAGYTGEYVLRFTFVPVGSDGNFDYAITFTDSSAE